MRRGSSTELTKQDLTYLTYVKRTIADATGLPLDKFTCGMTKTGYIVTIEAEEMDELVAENWESMKDEDYEKDHPDEDPDDPADIAKAGDDPDMMLDDDETPDDGRIDAVRDGIADERSDEREDRRQLFAERLSRVGAYAL
jgi:hypothetical protein